MASPPAPPIPLPPEPPEAWEPLRRIARLAGRPVERFLRIEAASGILLLIAAACALVWANSPWADSYLRFWNAPVGLRLGGLQLERSLAWVVNDGLMVIFFFVVGLEIRREIHRGELSEWRRAALPVVAALGGVLVPVALFFMIASGPATRSGWAVPMATDIAFAVGILTLLGKRVPPALRVLLLALAVIDDLMAIIVIAMFYSSGISLGGLGVAALGVAGLFGMRWLGVRAKVAYLVPGVVVWAGVYAAGIHPTIAGVLIGLLTPVRSWLGADGLLTGVRHEVDRLADLPPDDRSPHQVAETVRRVDFASREAMAPADSLIETLHPWVAFVIMPIFALANAGVTVTVSALDATAWALVMAVSLGLMVGKPVGIMLATWALVRLRLGRLPSGTTMKHIAVLGLVGGVGFTMALFIAQLAFADAGRLDAAKLGVLAASAGAALLGLAAGRLLLAPIVADRPQTANQAERD